MNADKLESKAKNTEGRSFVGASRDEMESSMSDSADTINLNKEVAKRGGEMTFDEILKLHGHK
jgi:formylmethanofuran dehydrogenase subunit A